jgi:hypothetical protein
LEKVPEEFDLALLADLERDFPWLLPVAFDLLLLLPPEAPRRELAWPSSEV